jgi:hypothetical protein
MKQFIMWYRSEPCLSLNRTVVLRFRPYLESLDLEAGAINQKTRRSDAPDCTKLLPKGPSAGFQRSPYSEEPGPRRDDS